MRRAALTLLIAGLCSVAWGAEAPSKQMDAVKLLIESRYPEIKIVDIRRAPVANLFELYLGDSIAYADETGEHLFVGTLIATKDRRDLTAESVSARNNIAFDSLPLDLAIKTVKGNGKRTLAIFSDPECPYCQKLETELASVTNVTIYTFLYPLVDLHPDAAQRANAIWCSRERTTAWSRWMLKRELPKSEASCARDPTNELLALGKQLRIFGTPTMYLANGRRIDGTVSATRLEELLGSP